MRIRTVDFPKFDKRNYAAIREHFDSVKPWQSKYNPDNERPIGQRACKLTSDGEAWGNCGGYGAPSTAEDRAADRNGARFNKAMRMLDDGSIAFRLYDTDCVVYHPDDSITIHGYASVSTNDFISGLIPAGITHKCRGRGRNNYSDPVLHLMPMTESWYPSDYRYPDVRDRKVHHPDRKNGIVINCDGEVTLNYSVEKRQFVPSEPDLLEPFHIYRIDRKAARQVSREYQLAKLSQVINAAVALLPREGYISQRTSGGVPMGDIMDALKEGNFAAAINLMPRGGGSTKFGRESAPSTAIQPGFLRRLRDHIYDHEGVVERVKVPILTLAQHERYKADMDRYD